MEFLLYHKHTGLPVAPHCLTLSLAESYTTTFMSQNGRVRKDLKDEILLGSIITEEALFYPVTSIALKDYR